MLYNKYSPIISLKSPGGKIVPNKINLLNGIETFTNQNRQLIFTQEAKDFTQKYKNWEIEISQDKVNQRNLGKKKEYIDIRIQLKEHRVKIAKLKKEVETLEKQQREINLSKQALTNDEVIKLQSELVRISEEKLDLIKNKNKDSNNKFSELKNMMYEDINSNVIELGSLIEEKNDIDYSISNLFSEEGFYLFYEMRTQDHFNNNKLLQSNICKKFVKSSCYAFLRQLMNYSKLESRMPLETLIEDCLICTIKGKEEYFQKFKDVIRLFNPSLQIDQHLKNYYQDTILKFNSRYEKLNNSEMIISEIQQKILAKVNTLKERILLNKFGIDSEFGKEKTEILQKYKTMINTLNKKEGDIKSKINHLSKHNIIVKKHEKEVILRRKFKFK